MMSRAFAALRRWRIQRTLARRAIPDALWALTLARFPFLAQLPAHEAGTLRELSTLFLTQKQFHGVGGFAITDEVAVAIAAQACLPILHLGLHWYDGFVGIIVHESEVIAPREWMDDTGVVHDWEESLLGEAIPGGPVTLCWQGVTEAGEESPWAFNVVIHEFAHVLDMRDGQANGQPPMPTRELLEQWQQDFLPQYEQFCERVDAGQDTVMDPYAAESPDEFFAVACESFFVSPDCLWHHHRPLYALLATFFRQDPRSQNKALEASPSTV